MFVRSFLYFIHSTDSIHSYIPLRYISLIYIPFTFHSTPTVTFTTSTLIRYGHLETFRPPTFTCSFGVLHSIRYISHVPLHHSSSFISPRTFDFIHIHSFIVIQSPDIPIIYTTFVASGPLLHISFTFVHCSTILFHDTIHILLLEEISHLFISPFVTYSIHFWSWAFDFCFDHVHYRYHSTIPRVRSRYTFVDYTVCISFSLILLHSYSPFPTLDISHLIFYHSYLHDFWSRTFSIFTISISHLPFLLFTYHHRSLLDFLSAFTVVTTFDWFAFFFISFRCSYITPLHFDFHSTHLSFSFTLFCSFTFYILIPGNHLILHFLEYFTFYIHSICIRSFGIIHSISNFYTFYHNPDTFPYHSMVEHSWCIHLQIHSVPDISFIWFRYVVVLHSF